MERVINTPTRGIGQKTLSTLRLQARESSLPLWQAATECIRQNLLPARALAAVNNFMQLISGMHERMGEWTLGNQMQGVIEDSQLVTHYEKEPREKMESRVENLRELVNAAEAFVLPSEDEDAGMTDLQSFLSHAALEAGETQGEAWDDCVQLMTLHSAKGLEFPMVFIVGMEDGLFPHQRSVTEAGGFPMVFIVGMEDGLFPHQRSVTEAGGRLEEERRLCYVGMTRAREHLCLCHAEVRRMYGSENHCRPSRFLDEIPSGLIEEIRPRMQTQRSWASPRAPQYKTPTSNIKQEWPFQLGESVNHKKFGSGTVISFEGSGEHARVQVNFNRAGAKWLVLAYANLSR